MEESTGQLSDIFVRIGGRPLSKNLENGAIGHFCTIGANCNTFQRRYTKNAFIVESSIFVTTVTTLSEKIFFAVSQRLECDITACKRRYSKTILTTQQKALQGILDGNESE